MKLFAPPLSTETRLIRLGEQDITYTLKRSAKRRTVGLHIDATGLTLSAPKRVSQRWLDGWLQEKSQWVLQKLLEMRARQAPQRAWRDGESLPFLGGELQLALYHGGARSEALLSDNRLLLVGLPEIEDAAAVRDKVIKWYRKQALPDFDARLHTLSARMDIAKPPFALSSARTLWGSCNARGVIRLNWRLIKAPPEQINYVVAHELAHLRHMNHSARFWAAVEQIFPGYSAQRAALSAQGTQYQTF